MRSKLEQKGCSLVTANYSSIQCITGPQRTYAGSESSREKMNPGIGDGAVLTLTIILVLEYMFVSFPLWHKCEASRQHTSSLKFSNGLVYLGVKLGAGCSSPHLFPPEKPLNSCCWELLLEGHEAGPVPMVLVVLQVLNVGLKHELRSFMWSVGH